MRTTLQLLTLVLTLLAPTVTAAAPAIWHPPAGVSGWFPKISPDGAYVAMGFGNLTVYERAKGTLHKINVQALGQRAFSGHWLTPTTLTVVVENDSKRSTATYAVTAPSFTTFTHLGVGGNDNCAGGGHWAASKAGASSTVFRDGVALDGAGLSLNCDMDPEGWLVHTFRSGPIGTFVQEKWTLRLYNPEGVKVRENLPPKGAANLVRVGAGGYIGWGYYGVSHMQTPAGAYLDITVTPNKAEGPGKAFRHKGVVWVATSGDGGIYLRPLGDKAVIHIPIPSVRVDVVSAGDTFVVAGNSDKGALGIAVVLDSEPRAVLAAPPPVTPPPPPPVKPPPVVTPPPPPAVDCGRFTAPERDVLKRIGELFPALRKSADDDGRRQFNEKLAQQLDYAFPTKGWGMKRASKTRPISKDSVARVVEGALCGWDTVNGSTREMNLNADGEVLDAAQVYVDVTATNHLGGQPPPPPPVDTECEDEVKTLRAQRDAALTQVATLSSRVVDLEVERDALKSTRDALLVENDSLKQRIAVLENAPAPQCEAKVPGWLRALGVRVGCQIVTP